MSELGQIVAATLMPLQGVRAAWLFGSRVRGTHREDSDLDLLVVYERTLSPDQRESLRREIIYELAGTLEAIGERADVTDADRTDSGVAFAAVSEGELVLERTKLERVRAQVSILRRYDDDSPRRQLVRAAAAMAVERMKRDRR
ncbi:MAG TPA: nucleotidyltransferase domain-containing protein [Myxococcales bacterium]|jgi:predicted nucleotidyltransferase|nr:nucleotidyltransferase domain-containing protein [Myxococcales bacterium]